jgi:hypothetical protein
MVGIHTGLPLPSLGEIAAQLLVYFLVEDYLNYWIHRLLHGEWGYQKIHCVHHEFTAPIGFAAPYAHWAEVLILWYPLIGGLTLMRIQQHEIKSQARLISRPDRGHQPTDGCGPLSCCAYTKGGEGLGVHTTKFAVTYFPLPHHPRTDH